MITTIEEIKEARALILQTYKELGFDIKPPGIGVMIEVPSVMVLIGQILKLVDFISIGSNDLTQYILAVDPSNNKVASLCNRSGYFIMLLKRCSNITKPYHYVVRSG